MQIGDNITFKGVEGFITFKCKDYITYCIHQYKKTDEERKHARREYTQVNVLIYRHEWGIIKTATKICKDNNEGNNANSMDVLELSLIHI